MSYPELDVDALLPRLVDQLRTLIEVDAMEFPLDAIPCESPTHASDKMIHDDGPGAMYLQIWHECFDAPGSIRVACAKQAAVFADRADRTLTCIKCRRKMLTKDIATVLGPVGSFPRVTK